MLPHTKQVKNLIENARRAREGIKKARVTNGAEPACLPKKTL